MDPLHPPDQDAPFVVFNSALFVVFFAAFFGLYHFAFRGSAGRKALLVGGSLVFYAGWDWRFVPLLVGTALLDHRIARAIEASEDARRRGWLLATSVIANLSVLGLFKYAGFFASGGAAALRFFGVEVTSPALAIALPVGISFYTFQSLSYTVDVYRRELRAEERFGSFLAAVSFFPHLVAGPIIRARTLLDQFRTPGELRFADAQRGVALICFGALKKAVADLLAGPADRVFDAAAGGLGTLDAWIGALAFTGQIYGDFSGYTDMALGVALLLGFSLPENFRFPYLAASPIDFWRRWHISLSSWLRDYLYVPLGGRNRRNVALMATMLLGGLWHGASLTFVAWGAFHGALLVLSHALAKVFPGESPPLRLLKWAATLYAVILGWVLFRAETFSEAFRVLAAMHGAGTSSSTEPLRLLALIVAGIVLGHGLSWAGRRVGAMNPRLVFAASTVVLAAALVFGAPGVAFIYFQF